MSHAASSAFVAKYQPDRAIGSTWHPLLHGKHSELAIQEDETAIVVYMLGEYLEASHDEEFVESMYATFVQPAANFMADFRDESTQLPHASYDLWEEKFLTNTYTTAITHRALLTAAELADRFEFPDDAVRWRDAAKEIADGCHILFDEERGALRKGYLLQDDGSLQFDNTLDVSSAYGALMFATQAFGSKAIRSTFKVIEEGLLNSSPSGGVPRYEHDNYFASSPAYLGNPWFVTTLWVAQYYLQLARTPDAETLIDWTLAKALPSGVLSEQINPTDGTPVSVTPLVWSHAETINSLLDLQA
jgi:GH15 family glucan-1,4-alpha-glucosidase